MTSPSSEQVVVVGLGADGWAGLGPAARAAVAGAEVLLGGRRHLALVPDQPGRPARVPWPSPLLPALPGLLAEHAGRRVVVLASGDPLVSGIGTTLVRLLGADRVQVLPAVSSPALARARLGWSAEEAGVVSLVGRPVALLAAEVAPGRRLLVLGSGPATPRAVAGLLRARGYGGSELVVLARLGAEDEHVLARTAGDWPEGPDGDVDPLHVLAVCCRAEDGAPLLGRVPGLPDDAYEHDGQLTKREVRAVVLSRLVPVPGQLLWDVGAGAGSIGIEWMRTSPLARAVAVERREDRAERIRRNAATLGVPGLDVVVGAAPEVLARLERPDAVFVGGGATVPGVVEACWEALPPGGRLVVDAVTAETEAAVVTWRARLGGDLVRTAVQRSTPVGSFTGWRAAAAVTTWTVVR